MPDAGDVRHTLRVMGERLAGLGDVTLVPGCIVEDFWLS